MREEDEASGGQKERSNFGSLDRALILILVFAAMMALVAVFASTARASGHSLKLKAYPHGSLEAPQSGDIIVVLPNTKRFSVQDVVRAMKKARGLTGGMFVRVSTDFSRQHPKPEKVIVSLHEMQTSDPRDAKRCFIAELSLANFVSSITLQKTSDDAACKSVDNNMDTFLDTFLVELLVSGN